MFRIQVVVFHAPCQNKEQVFTPSGVQVLTWESIPVEIQRAIVKEWITGHRRNKIKPNKNTLNALRLATKSFSNAIDEVLLRCKGPSKKSKPGEPWHARCLTPRCHFRSATFLDLTPLAVRDAMVTAMCCLTSPSSFPNLTKMWLGGIAASTWPHATSCASDPPFADVLQHLRIPNLNDLKVFCGRPLLVLREAPPHLQVLAAHFGHIKTLRLRQVQPADWITEMDLRGIAGFTAVTHLDFCQCPGITCSELHHLTAMTQVQHLALRGAHLYEPLTSIAFLTGLVSLDLQYCISVNGRSIHCLTELKCLHSLSLAFTGVSEPDEWAPCSTLAQMTSLEVLNLHGTFVAYRVFCLSALSNLRRLHLGAARIGGYRASLTGCHNSSLQHLVALTNLTRLQLSRCWLLTNSGYSALGRITSLIELDLRYTNVWDQHLTHLTTLQRLRALALDSGWRGPELPYGGGLWALTALQDLQCIDLGSAAVDDGTQRRFAGQSRIALQRDSAADTHWGSNAFMYE